MSPRRTLRIARWEVARSASEVDRRTVLALALLVVAGAALGPAVIDAGGAPDEGIYRVAVDEDSPYAPAVAASDPLRGVSGGPSALDAGRADLYVGTERVRHADTRRGRAGVAALRRAVTAFNDRLMAQEPDRAAAFPVSVTLRFREQAAPATGAGTGDGAADGTADGDGGTGDGDSGTGDGPDPGGGTEPGGTTADGTAEGTGDTGDLGGALGGAGGGLRGTQSGSPADIAPPFPFRSLVLAFAFLLPLNVVVQAYGSSVMGERLNRRGEPLLASPATRVDIVAGKTLPYLAAALVATVLVAVAVGGGPLTVLAVLPVALAFLAATLVAALFARSFPELTFLTVAVSVVGTTFAFVPAVFTDVHPIAAISPLSVVVADLSGTGTAPETVAFATVPTALVAIVLFALGTGVYREEDLFTQRSPASKAVDALAAHLTRRRLPLWGALAVPFAFAAELLAVAVLFVLPSSLGVPVLLGVLAVLEELAKSCFVYAGFARGRLDDAPRAAAVAGALAGLGFAVGEKVTLAAQFVGLPDLELGRAAFAAAGETDPLVLAGLLVAPFALHAGTAALSALGARRGPRWYAVGLAGAVGVHLAYNLAVVGTLA